MKAVKALVLGLMSAGLVVGAASFALADPVSGQRDAAQWLQQWHRAASSVPYAGTIAMTGARRDLRSARVWHATENGHQIERVDLLSGPARSMYRTDNTIYAFDHTTKTARVRQNMPAFGTMIPGMVPLVHEQTVQFGRYYKALNQGQERVANQDADVVLLQPQDQLRYGYRLWSDRRTGLLLKWQMLPDAKNTHNVLREVAFSDVQIGAPLRYSAIEDMLRQQSSYPVQSSTMQNVTLVQKGWQWKGNVPGYYVTSCYDRQGPSLGKAGVTPKAITQCVVSDGMASVSLFLDPHTQDAKERAMSSRSGTSVRTQQYASGHSITAVGEVPAAALQAILNGLVRK